MPSSTSDHSHSLTYPSLGSVSWNSTMITLFQNISDYLDAIGTTSITLIDDSNANELISFTETTNAVNYVDLANAATGNAPVLSCLGDDTNIGMTLKTKGTGNLTISNGSETMVLVNGSAQPEYLKIYNDSLPGGGAQEGVCLQVIGTGTAPALAFQTSTNGNFYFYNSAAEECLRVTTNSGSVNLLSLQPADTGVDPVIQAVGSDTDVGIKLAVQGSGTIVLGGNLDVNGNSIVSTSGGNITIAPDTSGNILLNGIVQKDNNPRFRVVCATPPTNVTGDGTAYTVPFDSETFDRNSDFNTSTGIFTAPIAGDYRFDITMKIEGIDASHNTLFLEAISSGGTSLHHIFACNPTAFKHPNNLLTLSGSVVMALSASDTVGLRLTVDGSGKTIDIGAQFSFAGSLIG